MVCKTYQGKFPCTYQQLIELPGIGPYTAAAIASFAFQLPYAVVDGNVFRVLARYFGNHTPTDSTEGKKYFTDLANLMLYQPAPGNYNQAIMDFGATICKPQQPLCAQCFLKTKCVARQNGWVHQLPVKEKSIQRSVRHFTYWVFDYQGKRAVRERTSGDIWQNLSEYYLMETDKPVEWDKQMVTEWLAGQGIRKFQLEAISPLYKQSLTHQHIKGIFITIRLPAIPAFLQHYQWISLKRLKTRAFPRFINQWMEVPEMP
jgi:A/G-specific adenine glycosylase